MLCGSADAPGWVAKTVFLEGVSARAFRRKMPSSMNSTCVYEMYKNCNCRYLQ